MSKRRESRRAWLWAAVILEAAVLALLIFGGGKLLKDREPDRLAAPPTTEHTPGETAPAVTEPAVTEPKVTVPETTAEAEPATEPMPDPRECSLEAFAAANDLSLSDYPDRLLELLEKNPETREFVLNYPLDYGKEPVVDMSEYEKCETIPLFMQWDRRWGYMDYGSSVAGLTGCGPVSLSMVVYYFTRDPAASPDNMIRFALDEGYCVTGRGTAWSLMDEGARQWGLHSYFTAASWDLIAENLEKGNPIICLMDPGDFTTVGHFLVMTGLEDGLIRVNDPNSYANSEKLWDYDDIGDQIACMWILWMEGDNQ